MQTMFEVAPVWTSLIISIPVGVIGFLIYATCTAKPVDDDEDEEPKQKEKKAIAHKENKRKNSASKKED